VGLVEQQPIDIAEGDYRGGGDIQESFEVLLSATADADLGDLKSAVGAIGTEARRKNGDCSERAGALKEGASRDGLGWWGHGDDGVEPGGAFS